MGLARACLNGVGQILFQTHAVTGLLFLAAVALADIQAALLTVLGVVASTGCAAALPTASEGRGEIDSGHYGFNGALVGAAITGLLPQTGDGALIGLVVLGAATTTLLSKALGWWLSRAGLPVLTLPFNLVALPILALGPAARRDPASRQPAQVTDPHLWFDGVVRGVSQVLFVDNLWSAALILTGLALASLRAASAAVLGAVLSVASAALMGADAGLIEQGLFAYNGVITAVAVYVAFTPAGRTRPLAVVGFTAVAVVLATLVYGVGAQLTPSTGLPPLTVPFCLVTLAALVVRPRLLDAVVVSSD